MPELPEVEIVRRGLEPVLVGARIERVEQRRADLRFPFPDDFAGRLAGRAVMAVGRRAKYLLITLADDTVLISHLGMTGRFTVVREGAVHGFGDYVYATGADPRHDHVVMALSTPAGPVHLVYNDPRRFGFMLLSTAQAWSGHPLFEGLGVEPLGNALSAAYLATRAAGRRTDLKAFLLDQSVVAGLGNIYVSEALHRAGLSPRREARTLARHDGRPSARAERLVGEIRAVLAEAIDAGGSTLKDYRHADGSMGGFQTRFAVYGRDGEPCRRPGCGGVIRRTVQANRATYACGGCQN